MSEGIPGRTEPWEKELWFGTTECNNAFRRPEDSGQQEPAVCSPDLLNL